MGVEEERRPELADLQQALERDAEALRVLLEDLHPADLAEFLVELEDRDLRQVIDALDTEGRKELLQFAEEDLRKELLEVIQFSELVEVIEELPADEVVDLLALTDEETAERVLRSVDLERAQGLRRLSRYDAESAGGLMTTDYVTVDQGLHVGDAIKEIRTEEGPAAEEEMGVFVIDDAGCPVGFVSDRELLTTPIHTPVHEVMETDLITAHVDDDQEEVANLVSKYSLQAVPVVDGAGKLIGVVSGEDALDVLEEELEEDIRRLVGASPEEQTHLPVLRRVRTRLPMQALTVVGGLLTATILDLALPATSSTAATDILRYLPIIIGLAGNVGIQSSTILVRAIATGEVSQDKDSPVLGSEVLVGTLIGIICGLTTTLVACFTEGDVRFAVALGGAISVAVAWAALLGTVVPMTCQRLGIDPAIVAGPFLITLSDISGAGIFVLVAYLTLDLGG